MKVSKDLFSSTLGMLDDPYFPYLNEGEAKTAEHMFNKEKKAATKGKVLQAFLNTRKKGTFTITLLDEGVLSSSYKLVRISS